MTTKSVAQTSLTYIQSAQGPFLLIFISQHCDKL